VAAAGGRPFGIDTNRQLLAAASAHGPTVRWRLPTVDCVADRTFDAAIVCLVVEHLEDETTFLSELGRIVRPGGVLALVVNHPVFTAPESAPIEDEEEMLWRPGRYFGRGHTDERAGDRTVRFHHRTTADLLTAAATGGWDLERLVELGATETLIAAHPTFAAQRHIPRLMAGRWRRR